MNVTVRTVPIYLGSVEATLRGLETEPNYECLRREAARIDRTFRLRPPLDAETRTDIALHEWVLAGRQATTEVARRAKQAILQVAAYAVIHGLADSWVGVRRPAKTASTSAIVPPPPLRGGAPAGAALLNVSA